jgi:plastocyanin
MKKKALSFPALFPALVLIACALALASCGDGNGDTTVTEAAPATEEEPATTGEEPGAREEAPASTGKLERSVKVEIVEFTYQPDPVRVEAGGKVIWQNMDPAPHTATADDGSFDTGTLEEGKLKSESFKEPGTFTYFCAIHPNMHGTVEVIERE